MNLFLLNLLLALLWAAITGTVTLPNLVIGFGVGMVVLALVGRALTDRSPSDRTGSDAGYLIRLFRGVGLALFFIRELLISSLRVAWDVLTPGHQRPAIVAVPLEVKTDAEITLLANLVSLTPGTLSLDVSSDKKTLFVHAMYVTDPEALKRSIKRDFERRIKEVLS